MPIRSFFTACLMTLAVACGSESNVVRPPIAMESDASARDHVRGAGMAQDEAFSVILDWALAQHGGTLIFTTPTGDPATSVADVAVRLFMPAHGHDGFYPAVRVHAQDNDAFALDHLYPSMPGDWQVDVRATVNGTRDKAVLAINFPNETVERFKHASDGTTHPCH
jgi:hypothetical protein